MVEGPLKISIAEGLHYLNESQMILESIDEEFRKEDNWLETII